MTMQPTYTVLNKTRLLDYRPFEKFSNLTPTFANFSLKNFSFTLFRWMLLKCLEKCREIVISLFDSTLLDWTQMNVCFCLPKNIFAVFCQMNIHLKESIKVDLKSYLQSWRNHLCRFHVWNDNKILKIFTRSHKSVS